jgi:hypothetical protein
MNYSIIYNAHTLFDHTLCTKMFTLSTDVFIDILVIHIQKLLMEQNLNQNFNWGLYDQ